MISLDMNSSKWFLHVSGRWFMYFLFMIVGMTLCKYELNI